MLQLHVANRNNLYLIYRFIEQKDFLFERTENTADLYKPINQHI